MDEAREGVIGVWRVSRSGRLMGYLLAAAPAAGALSTWPDALTHPSTQSARSAAIATAVALALGLFAWWVLLRVRLELRTDGFVFTAYALSDLAGGTRQDDRFAELRRLAETRF
ncbi:hypothetical protein ABZ307_30900 [Streptomyces griseorubiginosus]|uniref:hypothetical protein n=1 Tax=Streptomyces griseorubiginosus TaxID=67304 RepID=UPI0033A2A8F8